MKKNVISVSFALLTLAVSMLFGAIFGSVVNMSEASRSDEMGRAVATSLK